MTNKQLFDSLNDADDKYIIEAVEDFPELDVRKKRGFTQVLKYALPCAACAAVVFAGASFIGNRGGFSPLSTNETNVAGANGAASTADVIYTDSGEYVQQPDHTYSDFLEEEKKFSETFVSPGIVYGEPLELPEKDPATFWEGDLPVMPLKNCTNGYYRLSGEKVRLPSLNQGGYAAMSLDAKRGEAVYAVADGEVTYIGYPGVRIGRGLNVIIKHGEKKYSSYAVLDDDLGIPVKVGDQVKAGQVIGYAGLNVDSGLEDGVETSISFSTYGCDPIEVYGYKVTEYFEDWLNSGLAKPLDNAGDDFDFSNLREGLSRNEKITPAPYGANVYAVSDGKIVEAGSRENGAGFVVKIAHEEDILTVYYHLDENLPHVEWGDVVKAGDVIGHVSDNSCSGVSGLGYFVIDETYVRDFPSYRPPKEAEE